MAETVRKKCAAFVYGATGDTLEGVLHALCLKKKVTVALAESCTGGLIASKIVSVAGSSRWFMGGVVAYSNNVKETALGVNRDTLVKYGAVSEQTALEMALGAKHRLSADFGLAVTGIAGPDGGTKEKPVGTVVIALCGKKNNKSTVFNFFGMRNSIRERAAAAAIFMIVEQLKKLP
jgi:nicotinamide-nucleotide amidase